MASCNLINRLPCPVLKACPFSVAAVHAGPRAKAIIERYRVGRYVEPAPALPPPVPISAVQRPKAGFFSCFFG